MVDIQSSPRMKTPISALTVFWKASKILELAEVKVRFFLLVGGVKSPFFV
jgi:hypothetical protein